MSDVWHPHGERKAICKACGAVMTDTEPMMACPDYHHPKGSVCVHDHCYPPRESYVLFVPKKARRANKRGARLGAKMTRRAARG